MGSHSWHRGIWSWQRRPFWSSIHVYCSVARIFAYCYFDGRDGIHGPVSARFLHSRTRIRLIVSRTAGGQYHWCSEFAPKRYQKQISYLVGWLGVLGWQIGATLGAFISGTIIQGLVVLSCPTYDYQRWHGTLIAMLITSLSALFNVFLADWLPFVESVILVLHFLAWIAVLVTLWVLAPRTPHTEVWNSFVDAGWGNSKFCIIF